MTHTLLDTLHALRPIRVAVVGDLMVDRTRFVDVKAVDRTTAAPVCCETQTTDAPGGAAYVARLLNSFGCDVALTGVTGVDDVGSTLADHICSLGIDAHILADATRPTTLKERIVTNSPTPRLLQRIDRESTTMISAAVSASLAATVLDDLERCDALVVSDYAKGVCVPGLLATLINAARTCRIPIVVDPASRSRFDLYAGCDILTPNRFEAETAAGCAIQSADEAIRAGRELCRQSGAGTCIVTLDVDGAVVVPAQADACTIPASGRHLIDATGAGDAFVAALTQAIASGVSITEASRFADKVAGLQIGHFGTAVITTEEIDIALRSERYDTARKCLAFEELTAVAKQRRQAGDTIVLTNGCFDLLHPGHVAYLEQAAAQGDCLVVAVNADATVRQLKGSGRPVMSADERVRMLCALACVDHVVVFRDPTPHAVIQRLRPDVLVKGGDYAVSDVVGREVVEAYGGRVLTLGLTPELSTTHVLQRLGLFDLPVSEAG